MRLVITNNPGVKDCFSSLRLPRHELVWVEGHTEDVLRRVRDLCHKNHRLITHPLTGSIKPNLTPYKTVVMEADHSQAATPESVLLAETAWRKTVDLLRDRPRPPAAFSFLDDFAAVDLDFFRSYLDSAARHSV